MAAIFQKILLIFIISSEVALDAFEQYKPCEHGLKDLVIQCADAIPTPTTPLEQYVESSPLTLGSGKNRHHHPAIIQTQENNTSIGKTINEFYQLMHLLPHYSQGALKNRLQQLTTIEYPYTGATTQQETILFLQKLLPARPSTALICYAKTIPYFYNATEWFTNSRFYQAYNSTTIGSVTLVGLAFFIKIINSEPLNYEELPLYQKIFLICNNIILAEGCFYAAMFYCTIKLFSNIFNNYNNMPNLSQLENMYKYGFLFTQVISKYQKNILATKKGSIFRSDYNNKSSLQSLKNICSFLNFYYKNLEKKYVQYLKNEDLINRKTNTLHQAYLSLLSNINILEKSQEKNGLSGFSWASISLANPGSTALFKQRFTLPVLEYELSYEKENYNAPLYKKMLQIKPYIQKLLHFNIVISHILQQVELLSKPQEKIPTTILKKLYT